MKVRNPEEIVMEEEAADAEINADATICCLDCDRNQSDWDNYQWEISNSKNAEGSIKLPDQQKVK
jgi:hypothetical protein